MDRVIANQYTLFGILRIVCISSRNGIFNTGLSIFVVCYQVMQALLGAFYHTLFE